MGDHDKQGKASGTQTGGEPASGATPAATPGKSTLTDGQTAEESWDQPPPQYAKLGPEIRHLLWRSRGHYLPENQPFWESLDAKEPTTFQTLTQIHKATSDAGLWEMIDHLDDREGVYTGGSSWGIHFKPKGSVEGLVGKGGDWGKDNPQSYVQDAHGEHGREYTWYRQNTGAGNAGLHVGIGGKNTNVHWDPTNPMHHVGHGFEVVPYGPMYVKPGLAVYWLPSLIAHKGDIDGGNQVVEGKSAAGKTISPDPFFSIMNLQPFAKMALDWATEEMSDRNVRNTGKRDQVWHQIAKAKAMCNDLVPDARRLSMIEAHEDPEGVANLRTRHLVARDAIVQGLAALWRYLCEDAHQAGATLDENNWYLANVGDWGSQPENRNMGGYAHGKLVALRKKRENAAK